ncbi:MAG: DNA alkylation repair protein [Bacteroidales bacterium]|nr:DNA alkylation repair protein [Bacteroidales bacterium]
MIQKWQEELRSVANPDNAKIFMSFFKTGKGEYGEGDKFIGLSVPENRKIAKRYFNADLSIIDQMLKSEIHEFRLSGFLALVERFKKCKDSDEQKSIVEFYVTRGTFANNWDLVDLSAPYILGAYLLANPSYPTPLYDLSSSSNLWLQRIAIVSTLTLIRHRKFNDTILLAEKYLSHSHPLIHKATGWMLREIGKKDIDTLLSFLNKYATTMPRVTLRYAIEKLTQEQRKEFMQRK